MRTEREEEEDGEEEKENSSQSLLLMQLDSRSWRANSVSSGKRIQETEEREERAKAFSVSSGDSVRRPCAAIVPLLIHAIAFLVRFT